MKVGVDRGHVGTDRTSFDIWCPTQMTSRLERISSHIRHINDALGLPRLVPLHPTPWIRSLGSKEKVQLYNIKGRYPMAGSVYELMKSAIMANDMDSVRILDRMDPPITWSNMVQYVRSSKMASILKPRIGDAYGPEPSISPVDDSFVSMVRAGRVDLIQDRILMEEQVEQYEEPGITSTMLMEKVPIDAIEWLISHEYWDGTPLARAVTMDRYEELANVPLNKDMMAIIIHYDAYDTYRHYKDQIMRHPELVVEATGRSRMDMLTDIRAVRHLLDSNPTIDDMMVMARTSIGTPLFKDVMDHALRENMVEVLDQYATSVVADPK